jgi:hypothetical protein
MLSTFTLMLGYFITPETVRIIDLDKWPVSPPLSMVQFYCESEPGSSLKHLTVSYTISPFSILPAPNPLASSGGQT